MSMCNWCSHHKMTNSVKLLFHILSETIQCHMRLSRGQVQFVPVNEILQSWEGTDVISFRSEKSQSCPVSDSTICKKRHDVFKRLVEPHCSHAVMRVFLSFKGMCIFYFIAFEILSWGTFVYTCISMTKCLSLQIMQINTIPEKR